MKAIAGRMKAGGCLANRTRKSRTASALICACKSIKNGAGGNVRSKRATSPPNAAQFNPKEYLHKWSSGVHLREHEPIYAQSLKEWILQPDVFPHIVRMIQEIAEGSRQWRTHAGIFFHRRWQAGRSPSQARNLDDFVGAGCSCVAFVAAFRNASGMNVSPTKSRSALRTSISGRRSAFALAPG